MTNYYDDPVMIMKAAAESQIASLKAALREALTAWEAFGCAAAMEPAWPAWDRIRELRKFLDDK